MNGHKFPEILSSVTHSEPAVRYQWVKLKEMLLVPPPPVWNEKSVQSLSFGLLSLFYLNIRNNGQGLCVTVVKHHYKFVWE